MLDVTRKCSLSRSAACEQRQDRAVRTFSSAGISDKKGLRSFKEIHSGISNTKNRDIFFADIAGMTPNSDNPEIYRVELLVTIGDPPVSVKVLNELQLIPCWLRIQIPWALATRKILAFAVPKGSHLWVMSWSLVPRRGGFFPEAVATQDIDEERSPGEASR